MKDYVVSQSSDLQKLTSQVYDLIKIGYVPTGGICVIKVAEGTGLHGKRIDNLLFYQALVLSTSPRPIITRSQND